MVARRALYDFEAVYTLAETRSGWRIAAIAHNQIPRSRNASRGVNPASELQKPRSVADDPQETPLPPPGSVRRQ